MCGFGERETKGDGESTRLLGFVVKQNDFWVFFMLFFMYHLR